MKITIRRLHCLRCDHRWVPTIRAIKICPKCKSAGWRTKRKTDQGRRKTS